MVGGEICQLLSEQGKPFKALVRTSSDSNKVDQLRNLGAQITLGDVRSAETLKTACQGVDTVICTISALPFSYVPGINDIEKVDRQGLMNLVDAAKADGVKHMIYTSFSKNLDLDFPLRNAKRAVEKHIKGSGLTFTILRPSCFMEVWLSPVVGFDAGQAKAQIYGEGVNPISWISYKDVARFAVESVTNRAAYNAELELGGAEAASPNQVVKLYETKLGRLFEVSHVPIEVLQEQYKQASDPMQQSFIGLMMCYGNGDLIVNGRKAFRVKPIGLTEYIG
jgi:NADH dehydrogenase